MENIVDQVMTHFDSQTELASFCNIHRSAVSHWKAKNTIPQWYASQLSQYTGIPVWELCPQHFKKEERAVNADTYEIGAQGRGEDRKLQGSGS